LVRYCSYTKEWRINIKNSRKKAAAKKNLNTNIQKNGGKSMKAIGYRRIDFLGRIVLPIELADLGLKEGVPHGKFTLSRTKSSQKV
jgi:hypothetical protein